MAIADGISKQDPIRKAVLNAVTSSKDGDQQVALSVEAKGMTVVTAEGKPATYREGDNVFVDTRQIPDVIARGQKFWIGKIRHIVKIQEYVLVSFRWFERQHANVFELDKFDDKDYFDGKRLSGFAVLFHNCSRSCKPQKTGIVHADHDSFLCDPNLSLLFGRRLRDFLK